MNIICVLENQRSNLDWSFSVNPDNSLNGIFLSCKVDSFPLYTNYDKLFHSLVCADLSLPLINLKLFDILSFGGFEGEGFVSVLF